MTNYTKGYSYENFVETVYKAILETESKNHSHNSVSLKRRKKIISKSGTPSEIDIFWKFEQAGITHAVAIECKNEKRNVSISSVRDFARKISDISGLKGLIVSSKGFSANAIKEAQADNIDLLIIRQDIDKDWEGRLKQVHLTGTIRIPPEITQIKPFYDKQWLDDNGFKAGSALTINAISNKIVIADNASGFRESVHSLICKNFFEPEAYGEQVWIKPLQDGCLLVDETNDESPLQENRSKVYPLKGIVIEYFKPFPYTETSIIDLTEKALAIMEYVSGKNGKFLVLKNGDRKSFDPIDSSN